MPDISEQHPDDYCIGATTAIQHQRCVNQNRLEGISVLLGYFLDNERLLFFMTADYHYCICVYKINNSRRGTQAF